MEPNDKQLRSDLCILYYHEYILVYYFKAYQDKHFLVIYSRYNILFCNNTHSYVFNLFT
jgi:hypothetical protein